ncbi:MAG: DUF2442 domain-containing protein, partial [Acidobacteriota bacterium]|nr:DUF2442 domain-containing protein [Acidobacteriota bacterium]
GKWEIDEEELEQQHSEAVRRGEERMATEPQAKSVSYDRKTNRLMIEMENGSMFILPCELLQGLAGAAPEDIAEVELLPYGNALHWERLDADFSVAGLLAGDFGNRAWMAELRRKSESASSDLQMSSTVASGKKGRSAKNGKRRKSA